MLPCMCAHACFVTVDKMATPSWLSSNISLYLWASSFIPCCHDVTSNSWFSCYGNKVNPGLSFYSAMQEQNCFLETLLSCFWPGLVCVCVRENSGTNHSNAPHSKYTPWEHATRCPLPRSVLVDHVTVLLVLWCPNGGGLAIANALARAWMEGVKRKRIKTEICKKVVKEWWGEI